MSAIIGYVDDGKVYFATDTQRSIDRFRYTAATDTGANVFNMPNNVMCAIAGLQATKQLVMAHPEWFEGLKEQPLTKQYIVENIIPNLYQCIDGFDLLEKDSKDNGESEFEGAILLAQKDKLFCIDGDFSVVSVPKFCIVGSEPIYSYPRVESYNNEIPLKDMLYLALTDAKKYCNAISGPYYLYSTDGNPKELLGGNLR